MMHQRIRRLSGFLDTLNNATDRLLKSGVNAHRAAQTVHPLVAGTCLSFVRYNGEEMALLRANHTGA